MLGFIIAAASLLATYLYTSLRYKRYKQFAHLPQLPTSLLFGHLGVFDDYMKRREADRHIDFSLEEMRAKLGNPPIMFVDFRPVQYPMLVIADHRIAEQIAKPSKLFPYSVTKSPTLEYMTPILGKASLVIQNGEEWKAHRKRFNPGFAPQHLMTLLPCIVEKTELFLRHLDDFSASGEVFSLEKLLVNLTFDIIGKVVMNVDLDAQHLEAEKQGEIVRLYTALFTEFANDKIWLPAWMTPRKTWRRRTLSNRINALLGETIREKFRDYRTGNDPAAARSVMALSLTGFSILTSQTLSQSVDQVKTFLFAGHDTTSAMLAWAIYELSRTPHALKAVCAELDELFGPDPSPLAVRNKILAPGGDDLVRRMSYMSAVIKETLRIHSPAGSSRMAPPGTGYTLRMPDTGEELLVDGCVLYGPAHIIQRDPQAYGETAHDWVPERWLGNTDTGTDGGEVAEDAAKDSSIPATAWRAFERGPRNCIGQQLANIEARVILAMVARRYDFTKVGLGEVEVDADGNKTINDKNQFTTKSELYNTISVTSKPADKSMMRVKVAAGDASWNM